MKTRLTQETARTVGRQGAAKNVRTTADPSVVEDFVDRARVHGTLPDQSWGPRAVHHRQAAPQRADAAVHEDLHRGRFAAASAAATKRGDVPL